MHLHLLELSHTPILEQLQLEEALLRLDDRNFCLINVGSAPSIVMGISSKPEELIRPDAALKNIPVIRRFSGGGCVVVGSDTLFVTFIFSKEALPIPHFPEPILSWSENFYQQALPIQGFQLRENDFAIGRHKCGGNAQYIKKERWLLHTSFLWDYHPENMDLLLQPKKIPSYREDRGHREFLCKLKDHLVDKEEFTAGVKRELASRFRVAPFSWEEGRLIQQQPHRKSTVVL